jgi:hypothetical protein
LKLFADYLESHATFQVNISHDLSRALKNKLKLIREQWKLPTEEELERNPPTSSPPPPPFPLSGLYAAASASVFDLMEADSFRRFLLTPDFESLLARADEDELRRLGNQQDVNQATEAVLQQAEALLAGAGVGDGSGDGSGAAGGGAGNMPGLLDLDAYMFENQVPPNQRTVRLHMDATQGGGGGDGTGEASLVDRKTSRRATGNAASLRSPVGDGGGHTAPASATTSGANSRRQSAGHTSGNRAVAAAANAAAAAAAVEGAAYLSRGPSLETDTSPAADNSN